MAYGDSANWDGKLPASTATTTYTVEWKVYWRGVAGRPFLTATMILLPGDDDEDVTRATAD